MKTQQNSTTTMTRDVMPMPNPRIRSGVSGAIGNASKRMAHGFMNRPK